MSTAIHYDEFYDELLNILPGLESKIFDKMVLIEDINGKLKFLIWTDSKETIEQIKEKLLEIDEDQVFFTSEVWQCKTKGTSNADKEFYESIWQEAEFVSNSEKIKFLHRVRNRSSWFQNIEEIWPQKESPKLLVFYSFKGGVGRTTSLAATALDLSKKGKNVVVIDADFDAPGAGILFPPDKFSNPGLGVMDYLLETSNASYPLKDYYHEYKPVDGEPIFVFPSANLNTNYLAKLARLDMEPDGEEYPLKSLLSSIKKDLTPDYILIDGRAGLADSSGILLNGFAHLYVLFGTISEQSWQGLEVVIERLGKKRINENKIHEKIILVQTMVPQNKQTEKLIEERFKLRAWEVLKNKYYYPEEEKKKGWSVADKQNQNAPHQTISIRYFEMFSTFQNIAEVEDDLLKLDHRSLFNRIEHLFGDNPNG